MSQTAQSVLTKLLMFAMLLLAGSGLVKHQSTAEHMHEKIHDLKQSHDLLLEKLERIEAQLDE